MHKPRYDWHRDILGLPFTVGALFFGMAIYDWWLGIGLMFVALVLFSYPYRAYFSNEVGHPRRRHIGTNLLFVLVEIVFWGIAFASFHAFKHAPAI